MGFFARVDSHIPIVVLAWRHGVWRDAAVLNIASHLNAVRLSALCAGVGFALLVSSPFAAAQTDLSGDIAINPDPDSVPVIQNSGVPRFVPTPGTGLPIRLYSRDSLAALGGESPQGSLEVGVEAMRLGGLSAGPVVSLPSTGAEDTGVALGGDPAEPTELGGFLRFDLGDFAAELRVRQDLGGIDAETSADLGIGYTTRLSEALSLTTGLAAQLAGPLAPDTIVGRREDRLGPTGFTVLEPGAEQTDFAASLGVTLSFDFDLDLTLSGTYSRPDPALAEGTGTDEQGDQFFTGIDLRYSF